MIDGKKIGLVHVAAKQLGLDEDEYRAILARFARVGSAKDLDETGFRRVMDHMNALGFRSTSNRANLGDRPGMASPGQVALLRRLWAEYTDGAGSDLTLGRWLARTFKVEALRFLPASIAPKAIAALKTMLAKKRATRPAA